MLSGKLACAAYQYLCIVMVWYGVRVQHIKICVWLWYTMVWCGHNGHSEGATWLWYGMVWYGMVWYGMVWCVRAAYQD